MRNQEFLILPPDDVAKLLSSDDLNVPNEETIFHAFVMWAKHDTTNRRKHLAKLLAHIKLPLMAPQVTKHERLHSSRMRTARSLTVSPSMLSPGGGGVPACLVWGECLSGPGGGGCLSGPRGVSQHALRQSPSPQLHNHRHLWKYNLAPTSLRVVNMSVHTRG